GRSSRTALGVRNEQQRRLRERHDDVEVARRGWVQGRTRLNAVSRSAWAVARSDLQHRASERKGAEMKTTFRLLAGVMVASLLTVSGAMAHHSFAMFDRSVEKVITGAVVRWAFNAPHSWLYVNVKNADGTETLWSFEGSAPPALLTRGIS